jgi:hypothetical protein
MFSDMNRDFVEVALAQAERHVAQGEIILARQRARVAASERMGRDVARCKEFLSVFEKDGREALEGACIAINRLGLSRRTIHRILARG